MKTLLFLVIALPLVAEEKLSKQEQLEIELASVKLENIALRLQMMRTQEAELQKSIQAIFEAVCKRAGLEIAACQYDPKTQSVTSKK
jgi:peroxiredoxin family protein